MSHLASHVAMLHLPTYRPASHADILRHICVFCTGYAGRDYIFGWQDIFHQGTNRYRLDKERQGVEFSNVHLGGGRPLPGVDIILFQSYPNVHHGGLDIKECLPSGVDVHPPRWTLENVHLVPYTLYCTRYTILLVNLKVCSQVLLKIDNLYLWIILL